LVGGMALWLEEVGPERVIGITGTKGKSTTTALAAHLAQGLGVDCFAGGNIGRAPWDPACPSQAELWVIEISSYQATDLWSSPAVAAVTSLFPDHLDWHGSVDNYYRDKLSLCGRQGARITIANGADQGLRAMAARLRPGPRWVEPHDRTGWTAALGLRGPHNLANALIAAACLEEMQVPGAGDPERLSSAAQGFLPLPHRLETVAEVGGVEYVDDSLSTNVLPAIAAARAFEGRPLALIAGGFDRGIDYAPLGAFLAERASPTLVITVPQNGERIRAALTERGCQVVACNDISQAVRHAALWAPRGGVVLLSPAAASYGLFANYEQRAAAFRSAVASLGTTEGKTS
jgi:UDP-N-acetylmuramoyl-L-alanine---L-glutamate ligase